MQNYTSFVFLIFSCLPFLCIAQEKAQNNLNFEVKKVYPYLSVSESQIAEIKSIDQFKNEVKNNNLEYKAKDVNEYISVEISTHTAGQKTSATGQSPFLNAQQKELLKASDTGSNIDVSVQYIPENNLRHNEVQEASFQVALTPEHDAKYIGGEEKLMQYLHENAISKITPNTFQGYDLTAIKFTISHEGAVTNAHIFGSEYGLTIDQATEDLLLNTIKNMPCWQPAEYANGTKTEQDFVLTVGNSENCIAHLLNTQ